MSLSIPQPGIERQHGCEEARRLTSTQAQGRARPLALGANRGRLARRPDGATTSKLPIASTASHGSRLTMPIVIWFSLLIFIVLLLLLPLAFGELMVDGLAKLHLTPSAAVVLVMGIVVGGFINIPVKRLIHREQVSDHPFAVFGLSGVWPQLRRTRHQTIIAVNVGGCLIPTALAVYELIHLVASGTQTLFALAIACGISCAACYLMARPVVGVGIMMPGLVPPLISAALAIVLAPDQAAAVAFVAGVAGPLVGADLLHLKDIQSSGVGMASIGGAGTFDGIVLSGVIAAYLA
jgi:uncharacterized membrane protein